MNRPAFIYAAYLPGTTVAATDTAAGYAPADVLEGCEDSGWKPVDTTGSKSLTLDLGGAFLVGALAMTGEYLNGVTLEVRASSDNFALSDVQVSPPASIVNFTTAWRNWSAGTWRYWRLIFSGIGASFLLHHVALGPFEPLPFHGDGHDPDTFGAEGDHLVSVSGYYLGNSQRRAMRAISLGFGQVTADEYVLFQRWADVCVRTLRPFFYVPDTDGTDCLFGWIDAKYKFSAPYKNGLRDMAKIPFNARVV